MTTRSNIESQIKNVRKRVSAEAAKRKKQVAGLRAKAAEAALHWVISHEDRVNAFRSSVKGTPVAKALLKKSGAKPAAKKRPAAKKAAAKKKPAARKASARKK
jgi:DNA-binding protein H-NS